VDPYDLREEPFKRKHIAEEDNVPQAVFSWDQHVPAQRHWNRNDSISKKERLIPHSLQEQTILARIALPLLKTEERGHECCPRSGLETRWRDSDGLLDPWDWCGGFRGKESVSTFEPSQ
jgi:hypothetical protein